MSSLTILLVSIVTAVIPTIFFIGLIYWVDRYEKEPWWLLSAAFLWGAIPSVIVAFIVNTVASLPFYLFTGEAADTLTGVLIAPLVEESIKGAALLGIFLIWRDEIDSPLDGIIYGAMVGMGFAMVENIYYFVNVYNAGGLEAWSMNVFFRAVIFGLNHALFTSMTGLGIAIARLSKNGFVKFAAPVGGWTTAVFLHSLHNLTVSFGTLLCFFAVLFDWGGILLVMGIMLGSLLQERQWLKKYLAEEAAMGTLSSGLYHNACSGRKRGMHKLDTLFSNPGRYLDTLRFYQQCSELAYKKHHYMLFKNEKTRAQIENLRTRVNTLSKQLSRGQR